MERLRSLNTYSWRYQRPQQITDEIPMTSGLSPYSHDPKHTVTFGSLNKDGVDEPKQSGRTNTGWNPRILSRPLLLTFALFAAAVVATLGGLYSRSQTHQGIAETSDKLHYLWTYGPTAFLILFTVVWRQVDYAIKSLQPWAEMANGPVSAERSLLLDYITPFQATTLWRSVLSGHYGITLSVIVFFLTKVLTIVSTGLLTLQPIHIDSIQTTILYDTVFDGASFAGGSVVDTRPAYSLYAIQAFNTTYPPGTNDLYSVQKFSSQSGNTSDLQSFTATVDGFRSSTKCEPGSMNFTVGHDNQNSIAPISSYWNTTVSLPGCDIYEAYLDSYPWMYNTSDENPEPRYGYSASFQPANCSNLANDDPLKWRFLVTALYIKGTAQNENEILKSSNIVCIPEYSIQSVTVTTDAMNNIINVVPLSDESRQLSKVSAADLTNGVDSTIKLSTQIDLDLDPENSVLDAFMQLGAADMEILDPKDLLDRDTLGKLSERTYQRLSAQIANTFLMTPVAGQDNSAPVSATKSQSESRLVVRQLPARIMQGLAAAICLLTVVITFLIPRGVLPRDIDAIAPLAAIIARSPGFRRQLRMIGHLDMKGLGNVLSQYDYRTLVDERSGIRTFSIRGVPRIYGHPETHIVERARTLETFQWWRPWILTRRAMLACLISPIAVIIALEITYRKSNSNQGLADVDAESLARYAWTYVPTLVLVLIGTLYNSVDFELELSAPYYALSKEYCDAKSSIFYKQFRGIALQSVWLALRKGKFALAAASMAIILSPLLTIVVSGLFLPQATTNITPIELQSLSWFNTTGCGDCLYTSTRAKSIPGLIIQGNLTYPAWTYDELALPQLSLLGDVSLTERNITNMNGIIDLTTSALRAGMNCTLVQGKQLHDYELNITDKSLMTNFTYPTCDEMVELQRASLYSWEETPWYIGSFISLGSEAPCAAFALTYALINEDNEVEHLSIHLCSPSVEMVQVNATFNLPDFSITSPPIVDESSATPFSEWYDPFPEYGNLNVTKAGDIDSVFSAMIAGKYGVPLEELADSQTIVASFTKLYRIYAAQIFNTDFRSTLDSLPRNQSQAQTIPLVQQALYLNPNRIRLFQSEVSTRILQGLLAGLLVCGLIVFILIDARKVLSKPLGTIAATATLLASSTMVDEKSGCAPPPGAEWWSDSEWKKQGIWADKLFRMGWWYEQESSIMTATNSHEAGSEPVTGANDTEEFMKMTKDFRIDTKPPV